MISEDIYGHTKKVNSRKYTKETLINIMISKASNA